MVLEEQFLRRQRTTRNFAWRAETARDDSFEQQGLSLSADRRKDSRNAPRSSKNTSSCGPGVGWAALESTVTPDLLKEAGYTHLLDWPLDDQQVWMQTRTGPLLSVPYPMELNDAGAQAH